MIKENNKAEKKHLIKHKGLRVLFKLFVVIVGITLVFSIGFLILTTKTYLSGSMNISAYADKWKHGNGYYSLQYVAYCENPADITRQCLSIYVPELYMNADGTINRKAVIGNYTAETAPILYINRVSGYREVASWMLIAPDKKYLEQGYVLVYPASRGSTTRSKDKQYIGRSPYGLVDLKAGIRFIKANANNLPGNTDRIISVGSSAGGAMGSLLGTTGNSGLYTPYLKDIGAIMNSSDDIFATVCYCPVTDLEHADLGYEWMYGSSESKLNTEFLKDISAILRADFINYVNSLQTKHPHTSEPLTFGIDGRSGTFYNYLLEKLNEAATVSFLAEGVKNNYTWISWDGSAAHITDFNKMIAEHNKRFKGFPSFDSFKMNSMENVVFGDISDEGTHFCVYILFALNTLKDKYPDEYAKYHDAYSAILNNDDLALRVMLYNPMNFIGTEHDVDIAPYFRIRVGSKDNHTSYTVSLILALKLQETGKTNVDHAYIWGAGHGSIARADTGLIEWIDTICR